jgi:hypothetical protein
MNPGDGGSDEHPACFGSDRCQRGQEGTAAPDSLPARAGERHRDLLPYDHGLEHGPRDFAGDPSCGDPRHIIKLALEGGFNGIAVQIGLASKFYWEYAGEVPLVLKLNGKTDIPAPPDPPGTRKRGPSSLGSWPEAP